MSEPARNYAKPFAIGGFIVAEIIMVFTMLAPNMQGAPRPPIDHLLIRLLVGAFFFGPFGLAAGTGLGLLFTGSRELFLRYRRSAIVGLLVGEFFLAIIAVAFGTYTKAFLKDGTIIGRVLPVLVFGINGIAGGILIGALLAKSRIDAPRPRSDWEED